LHIFSKVKKLLVLSPYISKSQTPEIGCSSKVTQKGQNQLDEALG
jgi:hypothetical protein